MTMIRRQSLLALGWFLLLLGCTIRIVATEESNDNDPPPFDFNQDKVCPNYRCSAGMTPVPKTRGLKYTSTGCSSMTGSVVMTPGSEGGEEPYAACCDQWHACYQVCGVAKQHCDEGFKACAKETCGEDEECTKQADLSSLMIGIMGCQRFDQAQYAVCECVSKDKAPTRREAAIEKFYKKHAPDNVDKAKELAKKADTAPKLATLFRKLLQKYPDAITKVEDPQQAMFRNMMKDQEKKEESKEDRDASDEDDEEVQEL